jgi:predicted DCC family thiol-disulfide oxidoreductase YuxK
MKEVAFLRKRDAAVGSRIDFVDIAAPDYRPEDNAGVTFQQAMERIHAILPDGTVVRDIEVFRRLYEAVGLGWVYAITSNKAVEAAANALYGVWAKYRTQITGAWRGTALAGREALALVVHSCVFCALCGCHTWACHGVRVHCMTSWLLAAPPPPHTQGGRRWTSSLRATRQQTPQQAACAGTRTAAAAARATCLALPHTAQAAPAGSCERGCTGLRQCLGGRTARGRRRAGCCCGAVDRNPLKC